jgi:signal transduction histidine kinase
MKHLRETTDPRLVAYLGYVNSAVNELRRQLRHLAPSLRYVREKKEPIDVVGLLEEVTDYHRSRFEGDNIEVKIEPIKTRKFVLLMNKGKLVQILDNIFLNSEYWIREDLRLERIKRGIITVEIDKPFIRIRDNAEGIDPKIETLLFEPFVTTKGKQKGRGLGLFIVKQLLDSEGCTISLLPKRNRNKRFYIFEINLSGALNEP